MSKSGITFEVNCGDPDKVGKKLLDSGKLETPEAQKALELIQSRLLVRDRRTGQLESLDIERVETYAQGLDPRYAKVFDAKERKPGTLFVVKFRRTALVNVVVDTEFTAATKFDVLQAIECCNTRAAAKFPNAKRKLSAALDPNRYSPSESSGRISGVSKYIVIPA